MHPPLHCWPGEEPDVWSGVSVLMSLFLRGLRLCLQLGAQSGKATKKIIFANIKYEQRYFKALSERNRRLERKN